MWGRIRGVFVIFGATASIFFSSAVYGHYKYDVNRESGAQVMKVYKEYTFSRVGSNEGIVRQWLAWRGAEVGGVYLHVCTMSALAADQVSKVYTTRIPNISFVDEEGRRYFAKEFYGQIVIIYIWASWCLSCINELQQFNVLKEKLLYEHIYDVEILPITVDFKGSTFLQKLYKEKAIDKLGIFFDKQKEILKAFFINVIPTTIVLDKELHIIQHIENQVDWSSESLYQWVVQLKKG